MINIAICDDDRPLAEHVKQLLCNIATEQGIAIDCELFFDGSELIEAVMKQRMCFDLIYLDIEMKNIDGIHTALTLREAELPTLIVYLSGHEEYLKDLFCTDPFRFLSKPIEVATFRTVFSSACDEIGKRTGYFTFSYKKACYRIPLSRIICFESSNRIITIHMAGSNSVKAGSKQNRFYGKMNAIEKQISALNGRFLRIHQSFLVNFDYIKMITALNVEMLDGRKIQISEDRSKAVKTRFLALSDLKWDNTLSG